KTIHNPSPQAARDAVLMCLLLDHGLRASEMAQINAQNIDLQANTLTFFRPKVKGTDHERTTHQLTDDSASVLSLYLDRFFPPALIHDGPLILATTRLKKDGTGGELEERPLNRIRISERVAYLGKQHGIFKLSAHDCRHYCATKMARLGYTIDELMAWFGWTSAQTAMRYITAVDVKKRHKG
ncbi:MAG: site-specific integrase, partial [Chloroflexota bacterium]